MGIKSRHQVKMNQQQKRKKNRDKLTAKGAQMSDYYYGKFFLKTKTAA